jgi:hypothetical protein
MARYHGKSGVLYLSTTGSGVATTTVSMASISADFTTDTVETTSFGDPNKTYVQGLKDIKGAFSGFLDDTGLSIFTAADSADGCKMYIYPSSLMPTVYWYGPAWLNASIAIGVSAADTVTGNFSANGAWGRKP